VATLVVSTGLVMLPPSLVSLPLKLLVFVAADGWTLVIRSLLDGVGATTS
jgi:flagellar biosynthetic protein FliP